MITDNPDECGVCGVCDVCRSRVMARVEDYVRRQRRSKRWGRDAYVKAQSRMLAAMLGLVDEDEVDKELRLSDWGAAMQARQK